MALTQTLKIHGSGITTHPNGPNLNMTITLDNFYHNADNHIKFRIASASLVGGVASYPLDVVAWVALGSASGAQYSRTKLFSRTSYSSSAVSLASPITLDIPNPNNQAVYLVIGVMSICTCSTTATTDAIVNSINVTSQIPRIEPYFWRMQHAKDPSTTTGPLAFHLARPFYICKTINGVKGWCSCEDQTKLVYDANGNKIN